MPTYEYICTECSERTEVFASIAEKEKGLEVICPSCGSKKMVEIFGGVNVGRSSKSLGGGSGCAPKGRSSCCG